MPLDSLWFLSLGILTFTEHSPSLFGHINLNPEYTSPHLVGMMSVCAHVHVYVYVHDFFKNSLSLATSFFMGKLSAVLMTIKWEFGQTNHNDWGAHDHASCNYWVCMCIREHNYAYMNSFTYTFKIIQCVERLRVIMHQLAIAREEREKLCKCGNKIMSMPLIIVQLWAIMSLIYIILTDQHVNVTLLK